MKKVHRVIKFNQMYWLKPYIDMNTKPKKDQKKTNNDFEKDFTKLLNLSCFRKTMENIRKTRKIKLVATERKTNYLVSESNYHTTKLFAENLLAMEMRKTQILMNKPVYFVLLILGLSKTVMHEFQYDHLKRK